MSAPSFSPKFENCDWKLFGVSCAFGVVGVVLLALVLYFALTRSSGETFTTVAIVGPVLAGGRTAVVNVTDTNPKTVQFLVSVVPFGMSGSSDPTDASNVLPQDLRRQPIIEEFYGWSQGPAINTVLQLEGLQALSRYTLTVTPVRVRGSHPNDPAYPVPDQAVSAVFDTLDAQVPGPVTSVQVSQSYNNTPNPGTQVNVSFNAPKMYADNGDGSQSDEVVESTGLTYLVGYTWPAFPGGVPVPGGFWVGGPGKFISPAFFPPAGVPISVYVVPVRVGTTIYGPPFVTPTFIPRPVLKAASS